VELRRSLLGIVCALWASPAASAVCAATAVVQGDSPTADEVRRLLRERGVRGEAGAACDPVVARVQPTGDRVRVTVAAADGPLSARIVTDSATAATVIESWSRPDLEASLLAPRAAPSLPPPARQPPPLPVTPPVVAPIRPRAPTRAWSVSGLGLVSYASDASLWFDLVVPACAEFGPFCLGGFFRASFDSGESGLSGELETSRVAMDLVAMAELPMRFGVVTVSPGAGIGGGWFRSVGDVEEPPPGLEPIDGGALRFDAHVRAAVLRRPTLAVEFALFGDVAPVAHTARFVDHGVELAGEPRWSLRGGVGVRYVGP